MLNTIEKKSRKLTNQELPHLILLSTYAKAKYFTDRAMREQIARGKLIAYKERGRWYVYDPNFNSNKNN